MAHLASCLPDLDFLFMNEDEATMITGSSDPAVAAAVVLSKGVRTAVIKLSARGCAIYTHDCETICPAFDVEVNDTTGAGDCFVAGFLAASLSGASPEEAGKFANAVGALSVRSIGAVSGLKSASETRAWMQTARPRFGGV
jgi:sugar/nucleoside kinase (ribokinase family)